MQDNLAPQYRPVFYSEEPGKSEEKMPFLFEGEAIVEMGDDFDLGEYEVVRREFFSHLREPSLTFNGCKIHLNAASLARFPKTEHMQILINRTTKILALRPCKEEDRDSFSWCSLNKGKRTPKQVTCKLLFAKVFTMMGWNPDYRYKLLGTIIRARGEYLLAFDLSSTEVYQKIYKEGEKPKASRTATFPSQWQNQFGLPFYEHRQSMQVNIFDGYAIYAIKDNSKPQPQAVQETPVMEQIALPMSASTGGSNDGWR